MEFTHDKYNKVQISIGIYKNVTVNYIITL